MLGEMLKYIAIFANKRDIFQYGVNMKKMDVWRKSKMISIIVPVYNCEKYICRCIDSIIHQTYQDMECLIIDDGSTDRTPQMCDELAQKDDRIKVIHIKNGGVQAAREKAVACCEGEYIMFVDADDYIADSILEVALEALEEQNADIVCFNYITNGREGFEICHREMIDSRTALKYMLTLNKLDGNLWCKLYRANIVKNVKFEQRLCSNFITSAEIIERAANVSIIPAVGYYYSITNGSITHFKKCNPRIIESEKAAYEFYEDVKQEKPDLESAAEYFWLRSLLWVNIKMEKDYSIKRSLDWVRKEKNILRSKAGRFWGNPYFGIKDRLQFLLCYFNTYRIIYRVLCSWKSEGIDSEDNR